MLGRRKNLVTEREVLVRILKIDNELKKAGYCLHQVIVAIRVYNYGKKPTRSIYIPTTLEGNYVTAILGINCEFVSDDIGELEKYSEQFKFRYPGKKENTIRNILKRIISKIN